MAPLSTALHSSGSEAPRLRGSELSGAKGDFGLAFHGRLFGIPRLRLVFKAGAAAPRISVCQASGVFSYSLLQAQLLCFLLHPSLVLTDSLLDVVSQAKSKWTPILHCCSLIGPIHFAAGVLPAQLLFLALSVALEQRREEFKPITNLVAQALPATSSSTLQRAATPSCWDGLSTTSRRALRSAQHEAV